VGRYNQVISASVRTRIGSTRHHGVTTESFAGKRPAAGRRWLTEEQDWTQAAELGMLARVFNQDCFNLPQVQRGLEAAQYDSIVLARYQETKIRHHHTLLEKYLAN
jgi:hypothetical protein